MSIIKSLPLLVLLSLLAFSGCFRWDHPTNPGSPGSVHGRVYDAATNRPLAGVTVTTNPSTKSVVTDSSGRYAITAVTPRAYTVHASKAGYADADLPVTIVGREDATLDIPMKRMGEGRPGNALLFTSPWSYDGLDQGARVANARDLSLSGGSFTLEAWFKVGTFNRWQWIIGKAHSNAHLDYLFGIDGTRLVLSTRNAQNVVYSSTNIEPGRWYHAAGVQDAAGRKLYLYLDGQLVGSLDLYGSGVTIPNNILIGGRELEGGNVPVEGFNGVISDIRVWNVARGAREIAAARATRLTGGEAGLVAYWPMNDGSGKVLRDATGRGHTAELINGPSWIMADLPIR